MKNHSKRHPSVEKGDLDPNLDPNIPEPNLPHHSARSEQEAKQDRKRIVDIGAGV